MSTCAFCRREYETKPDFCACGGERFYVNEPEKVEEPVYELGDGDDPPEWDELLDDRDEHSEWL